MRDRRGALLIAVVLLLLVGALAVGRMLLARGHVPAAGAAPGGPIATSADRSMPAPPQAGASDDWMQPYRNMTLDQAFETVARRIRFEPYFGVQRGARGTARAQAGNAIDQTLLLAEILRASGHDVRLVHGSLTPQNAAALLRGFYPPRIESAMLSADYLPYDTTSDAQLVALVRDHYWVEVNQGSTWLPLDPSFPRAKVGEAYGTATDRFTEPPADLYQRVEFTWKIDTGDRGAQQVARWSGKVADLGLQPISLVVDAIPGSPGNPATPPPSAGGMFGGALTGATPPRPTSAQASASQAPTGIRYVRSIETDSRQAATGNVSLASQPGSWVRREWIEMKLTGPGGLDRTIDRTLYEAQAGTPSLHAEHRRYTILVVPGPVSRSYVDQEIGRARAALSLDEWRTQMAALQSQSSPGDAATTAVEKAASIDTAVGWAAGYLMTLQFAAQSDALTDQVAYANDIAVVRPRPRILMASSETRGEQPADMTSTVSLDLRLDEVQGYPYPGFPSRSVALFLAARGMQESVLEGQLVARWTGHDAVSTAALMTEATRKRVALLTIDRDDRGGLDEAHGLSPRARGEIEATLDEGREVIVPAEPIAIGGQPRWGWWDVDPDSGAIVGVMEGGQHQAIAEYSVGSEKIGINDKNGFILGCIVGSNSTMFFVCAKLLETGTVTPELIKAVQEYVENGACNTMCPAKAEGSANAKLKVGGDCYKKDKFRGMKPAVGAKASLKFCSEYNEGFKCAGGLILAGLEGEMPGVKLATETKVTLPCGTGR